MQACWCSIRHKTFDDWHVSAQQVPSDCVVTPAGSRVWVLVNSMEERWQQGTIVEERLHQNSYVVRADQYRDEGSPDLQRPSEIGAAHKG